MTLGGIPAIARPRYARETRGNLSPFGSGGRKASAGPIPPSSAEAAGQWLRRAERGFSFGSGIPSAVEPIAPRPARASSPRGSARVGRVNCRSAVGLLPRCRRPALSFPSLGSPAAFSPTVALPSLRRSQLVRASALALSITRSTTVPMRSQLSVLSFAASNLSTRREAGFRPAKSLSARVSVVSIKGTPLVPSQHGAFDVHPNGKAVHQNGMRGRE